MLRGVQFVAAMWIQCLFGWVGGGKVVNPPFLHNSCQMRGKKSWFCLYRILFNVEIIVNYYIVVEVKNKKYIFVAT